jgi:hypothetical protein
VPGGLLGLQNRWGVDRSPAGSIPVRLRHLPRSSLPESYVRGALHDLADDIGGEGAGGGQGVDQFI